MRKRVGASLLFRFLFLSFGTFLVIACTTKPAHAGSDLRFSFDLENAPLVSRSATARTDLAGFSSITARAHMGIGRNGALAAGLGLSPISAFSLLATIATEEAIVLPDPILNLQVPVTFTYFFEGAGQPGIYAPIGARFMIVPVLPCVNQSSLCPNGRSDAFAFGPAAEVGLGYQFARGAAWRVSLSYVHARLTPMSGETEAFHGAYHGFVLSFGGITDRL